MADDKMFDAGMFDDAMPECAKLLAVRERSQGIGEFLEWAAAPGRGYVLCFLRAKRDYIGDVVEGWQEYSPIATSTEKLLAEFFGIDLATVEREKQALLAALREACDGR